MKELGKIKDIVKRLNEKDLMNVCLCERENISSWDEEGIIRYTETLDIDTPMKLKKYLVDLWGNTEEVDELEKVIVVLAFMLRGKNTVDDQLKERIYNF